MSDPVSAIAVLASLAFFLSVYPEQTNEREE